MVVSMKAIVPKSRNLRKRFEAEIDKANQRALKLLENDVKQATKTWKNPPTFVFVVTQKGSDMIIAAITDDKRWFWIDQGTKPHIIRPKKATVLRFQTGYSAATAPNRIIARPISRSGNMVSAKEVHHPGIKARNLSTRIAKRNEKKFKIFMDDAMRQATK